MTLTRKQFKEVITDMVNYLNQYRNEYTLDLQKDVAYLTQNNATGAFHTTHMDRFLALETLYNVGLWFQLRDGKITLVIYN